MKTATARTFRFGDFEIRTDETVLRKQGEIVPLPRRAALLLLALLEKPGRVIPKEELVRTLWPGVTVDENNLNQAVTALRRGLGDSVERPRFLGTVARVGYRFLSSVEVDDGAPPAPAAPSPRTAPAVAVLSFEAAGLDDATTALAEGLAEGLTVALSRSGRLLVRAPGAVRRLVSGGASDPVALGRALDVDFVVDGRVRFVRGQPLVLSAELVRVEDGGLAFATRLALDDARLAEQERELCDLFTSAICGPGEPPPPAAPPPSGGPAYALYLQGRHYANLLSPEGHEAARACFERALAVDPAYAPASAGLAFLYIQTSEIVHAAGESMSRARRAAEEALRRDPGLSEAHACLGTVRFMYDWDAPAAEECFRKACRASQWAPGAHRLYGWFLALTGRFDEAFAQFDEASGVDPYALDRHLFETAAYWIARRYEGGLVAIESMLRLFPELWLTHVLRGRMLEGVGDDRRALMAFEKAVACASAADEAWADLGRCRARTGDRRGARSLLEQLSVRARTKHVPAMNLAQVHAGLGDEDALFDALDLAVKERSWYVAWLGAVPLFDPFREHPRFQGLLRHVGLWSAASSPRPVP